MSHLGESTFSYIMRKSGRKPTVCGCQKCQSQCHTHAWERLKIL